MADDLIDLGGEAAPPPAVPATPVTPPAAPPPVEPTPHDRFVDTRSGGKVEVPEPFWDAEAKGLNIEALLKSHGDLRAQISRLPKAPEDYDLTAALPEEARSTLNLDRDNPVVAEGLGLLKKFNLPQEAAGELVAWLARRDAHDRAAREAAGAAADTGTEQARAASRAEAIKSLGGEDKLNALTTWWKEFSGDAPFATDAKGLAKLAELRAQLAGPSVPSARGATGGAEALSEESLRQMMQDPRYWKTRDPAYIAKVSEGFRKLYPDEISA